MYVASSRCTSAQGLHLLPSIEQQRLSIRDLNGAGQGTYRPIYDEYARLERLPLALAGRMIAVLERAGYTPLSVFTDSVEFGSGLDSSEGNVLFAEFEEQFASSNIREDSPPPSSTGSADSDDSNVEFDFSIQKTYTLDGDGDSTNEDLERGL
jgi:hypothetical protein